jgi:hypothetical protein
MTRLENVWDKSSSLKYMEQCIHTMQHFLDTEHLLMKQTIKLEYAKSLLTDDEVV